jgi:oxalate decarboxylase/phosphoglucose isomerase-like protein (cupin superfamily)
VSTEPRWIEIKESTWSRRRNPASASSRHKHSILARRKYRVGATGGDLHEPRHCNPDVGGLFVVAPGARTTIHHHGEQATIAYVLAGACLVRWGERGEFSAMAHCSDFLHVPGWLPHMEINPSSTESFRWVVVRSTSVPIVVNLPDDYWGDRGQE